MIMLLFDEKNILSNNRIWNIFWTRKGSLASA